METEHSSEHPLSGQNLIDIGFRDYDDPEYRPVESWFFEPADALKLIEDVDYVVLFKVFPLRPYDSHPLIIIDTILVTDEAAALMEGYSDQKIKHCNQMVALYEKGIVPIKEKPFVYKPNGNNKG